VVAVGWPNGDKNDANARIFPFKVHRGRQPYDKVNKTLVIPRLFGKEGTGAYWADYDWDKSAAAGMAYAGLPFSGELGFVDSTYVFPITHMVAPKDKAVQCRECHSKNGRLRNLGGFYMPGRDVNKPIQVMGWILVLGSLAGVFFHGLGRMVARGKKED